MSRSTFGPLNFEWSYVSEGPAQGVTDVGNPFADPVEGSDDAAAVADRVSEAELVDRLATELGVLPAADPPPLGLAGNDGHVYSWAALVLAHVRVIKSLQDHQPGANER